MKLKKVASLCGKTKMFCLYDRAERDDVVSQWLGDGYAIYPITGLPYMKRHGFYLCGVKLLHWHITNS